MGAALALASAVTYAQPVAPEQANAVELARIPLRNAPSAVVAYWLNPAHQRVPILIEIGMSRGNFMGGIVDDLPRQPGNALGPPDLKLPDGIDEIISVDPQNVLLVKGTKEGRAALVELIKRIDVELKQTEVEVLLIELAPDELQELALPFRWTGHDHDDKSWPAVAEVSQATEEQLDKLRALATAYADAGEDGAAIPTTADGNPVFFNVLNAPRVTALDGITAVLISTENRGVDLSAKPKVPIETDEDQTPRSPMNVWQAGVTRVQSSTGIRVKCASKDDLIAMDLQVILNGETSQMSAIVRDGQKLAMLLPTRNPENGAVRVAIVAPRLIKREGENVGFPRRVANK